MSALIRQFRQAGHVRVRHYHHVSAAIRITVENDHILLAVVDHQCFRIVGRLRGGAEYAHPRRVRLSDVLIPPRALKIIHFVLVKR